MNKLIALLAAALTGVAAYAQPNLTVTPAETCEGRPVSLNVSPTAIPPGKTAAYYTFLTDTIVIRSATRQMSFLPPPGNHITKVIIHFTDSTTFTGDSASYVVYANPSVDYTVTSARQQCFPGNSFCFRATVIPSSLPYNPFAIAEWIYGDGSSDSTTDSSICYSFKGPGTYYPVVRVTDTKGCYSYAPAEPEQLSVLQTITPAFSWIGSPDCKASVYSFINNTPISFGAVHSFTWNFGDGNAIGFTAPFLPGAADAFLTSTNTYTRKGRFFPSLGITDTSGCTSLYRIDSTLAEAPSNIILDNTISAFPDPERHTATKSFCIANGTTVYLSSEPAPGFIAGSGDFEWNFGDMHSISNTDINTYTPQHLYTVPGTYIVSLTFRNHGPQCDTVITDTIYIEGPLARIEDGWLSSIEPAQKYQAGLIDTVDFVNNSVYTSASVKTLWDFDDDFAPLCTAYSVPKPGASLPFYSAVEQYHNSDHFYTRNGVTMPGKMNCRWSLDSLPRHLYTSWDSIYSWYIQGKTFPGQSGIPAISANTPITVSASKPVPDPFWQAQGKQLQLTSGTLHSATDSIHYSIPGLGSFTRYGNQTLPNSTLTFHEYVFRYVVSECYAVQLSLADTASPGQCISTSSVTISHGRPDAHGMGISRPVCSSSAPFITQFNFNSSPNNAGTRPGCGQTFISINMDSLADRKDNTPCTIDGFSGFMGGITPGGLMRPPFFSSTTLSPLSLWPNSSGSTLVYPYGRPGMTPPPADTENGLITIGLVVGMGCADPPYCTRPVLYSDTVWYHNSLQLTPIDPSFTIKAQNALHHRHEAITFTPDKLFEDSVRSARWDWGDSTATIDSFWYAGYDVTDAFYIHGVRRVRYTVHTGITPETVIDSLVFPEGLPQTPGRFSLVPYNTDNACTLTPNQSPPLMLRDSALILGAVTHVYTRTSAELSDASFPVNTDILRTVRTSSGCLGIAVKSITIGAIVPDQPGELNLCAGNPVSITPAIRYFRFDNQRTHPDFNPNRSEDVVYLDPPFNTYNYDTIDFWRRDAHNPTEITGIVFDPETNANRTIYTERVYWNFGDGSPVYTGTGMTHTYTAPGHYKISMMYRDSLGFVDTTYFYANVTQVTAKPVITDPMTTCGMLKFIIDSSFISGNPDDTLVANAWFLNNSSTPVLINTQKFIFDYPSARVTLLSISGLGCTDTAHIDIRLEVPRPQFRVISDSTGCIPFSVTVVNLTDTGSEPGDTPTVTAVMHWGDGTSQAFGSRGDTMVHTYTTHGDHQLALLGYPRQPGCPPVLYPDSTRGAAQIRVRAISSSVDFIMGPDSVSVDESSEYMVIAGSGLQHTWQVEGGTILSGTNTSRIEVLWTTPGTGSVIITTTRTGTLCSTTDTIRVKVNTVTGLPTSPGVQHIRLYPNPATTELHVNMETNTAQDIRFKVYDVLGKVCMSDMIRANGGTVTKTYSVAQLHKGVYFVEIGTAEGRTVSRLVVD
jgi:PKD repeat protein